MTSEKNAPRILSRGASQIPGLHAGRLLNVNVSGAGAQVKQGAAAANLAAQVTRADGALHCDWQAAIDVTRVRMRVDFIAQLIRNVHPHRPRRGVEAPAASWLAFRPRSFRRSA